MIPTAATIAERSAFEFLDVSTAALLEDVAAADPVADPVPDEPPDPDDSADDPVLAVADPVSIVTSPLDVAVALADAGVLEPLAPKKHISTHTSPSNPKNTTKLTSTLT